MFTEGKVRNGSSYLSEHLTANDYYCKEETVLGVWVGQGAERLGIECQSIGKKDEAFERLRLNRHPETDLPLTPRMKEDRIAFYDFQISAPKSVSIIAMTAGDERLIKAHEDCATRAFQTVLESVAARRDHTTDGLKTTGNLVAARFTHHASRELDAQLHCHFVCANATFDAGKNRWFALANEQMYEAVNLAGRLYQNDLAKTVMGLGYKIAQDRDERGNIRGFEITSAQGHDFTLTPAHRDLQSTRRHQIDEAIEKYKQEHNGALPSKREITVMARETRQKKLSEISTPEVIAHQRAKYSPLEQRQLLGMVTAAQTQTIAQEGPSPALSQAAVIEHQAKIDQSLRHCLERHSVTTQKEVLAFALAENVGHVDYPTLLAAVKEQAPILADKGTALTVITSHENLGLERKLVQLVTDGVGLYPAIAIGYQAKGLGDDQKKAVEKILESRDLVVALRGPAGTGKTTTLKTLDEAFRGSLVDGLKSAELQPVYVTPRHAAKEVLQQDGFHAADTIAATLPKIEKGELDLRGKILVVDEAGLLSTSEMARTLAAAEKAGCRVLLVGDEKQLSAIEAGDALAILRKHTPLQVVELTSIRRQENAGYRAAMHTMSQGKVADGLDQLDRLGLIQESGFGYLAKAAHAYQERADKNENVLLVAPTWAEIHQLNDLIRTERKAAGQLAGPAAKVDVVQSVQLTKAQRENIRQYREGMAVTITDKVPGFVKGTSHRIESVDLVAGTIKVENGKVLVVDRHAKALDLGTWRTIEVAPGDSVIFQRSDRKHGLAAGKLATVEKIGPEGQVSVSFAGKDKSFQIPPGFASFAHGYAITADKSQGKTTAHVIVAGQSIDAKRLYVATSRGRQTLELHVPDKAKLFQETPNVIKNRPAALDVLAAAHEQKRTIGVQKQDYEKSPTRLSLLQALAEKAREHYRQFRAVAEKWLTREVPVPKKETLAPHEVSRESIARVLKENQRRQKNAERNHHAQSRNSRSRSEGRGHGHDIGY